MGHCFFCILSSCIFGRFGFVHSFGCVWLLSRWGLELLAAIGVVVAGTMPRRWLLDVCEYIVRHVFSLYSRWYTIRLYYI